jgi:hypothetical protein
VVALEEAGRIVEAVVSELPAALADSLRTQAELKRAQARQIRAVLEKLEPFALD